MYSGVENASVNYAMRNETKKDNIFKLYLQGDTRVMETRSRQEPKHLGFLATASRSLLTEQYLSSVSKHRPGALSEACVGANVAKRLVTRTLQLVVATEDARGMNKMILYVTPVT